MMRKNKGRNKKLYLSWLNKVYAVKANKTQNVWAGEKAWIVLMKKDCSYLI